MRRRRALVAAALVVVVAGGGAGAAAALTGGDPPVRRQVLTVPVGAGPDGRPVSLDATLFLPGTHLPAPAVVLAHGFGGSKDDETADALALSRHGYVVLTYSARGFGHSGGQISLDSPQYEVKDAQRLVDLLATRSEVLQDAPGDPRVGFAGASYGGALALLAAGYDRRIDAIAPSITWNDLRQSLFPQMAVTDGPGPTPATVTPVGTGVFKRLWAGLFFSSGSAGSGSAGSGSAGSGSAGAPGGAPTTCGRFAADVCAAYQATAATGAPTRGILDLLARSSPATVLSRIHAPTLLVQGEADSLFPLSEADANARGIAAVGTPVKEVWYAGGHDAGQTDAARARALTMSWFDRYLRGDGTAADTRFEVTDPAAALSTSDSQPQSQVRVAAGVPGVAGAAPVRTIPVPLHGADQGVVAPAGGNPAAITSLPGLGSALAALGGLGSAVADLPGQSARFDSAPLTAGLRLVGVPSVRLRVSSTASDATLFAKLYDVSPDGRQSTLPEGLVSPVRLTRLPATGTTVRVALPALVHDFQAGHQLRVEVSTTDQGYAMPASARTYRIALAGDGAVTLPQVATRPLTTSRTWLFVLVAVLAALVVALAALTLVRRSRRHVAPAAAADAALAGVPLVISGLGKSYGDGFRAVSDLSLRVEAGQVVGLLGPNGAGKTTALRMLVGLIHPTEGEIRVFGQHVVPGAPVLSRVGAFIEGPGFLPHLSGADNLGLFWRVTGRPAADAHLEEALEIAGLGDAIGRKVRTYSQGMRQRLAIAQSMLGLPDLLVLDEPTNGLDPPQIRQLRGVLAGYAATGRTVVVSSHLLAEVEQTCTHCVVMHRGRLVAQGPVAELVGAASSVAVDVDEPDRAAAVCAGLPGVHDLTVTGSGLVLSLDGTPRATLVRALVDAGLRVDRVAPQRRLEEVFLDLVEER